MQYGDQEQPDRLAEVEGVAQFRMGQDFLRVSQIRFDIGGGARLGAGQQGTRVGHDERVVVDVDDPRLRGDVLGDLVGVRRGRDSGTDVEELPDPVLAGQEGDDALQEAPVLQDRRSDRRKCLRDRITRRAVGREVVFAAEPVVVASGRVRHARVDLGVGADRGIA